MGVIGLWGLLLENPQLLIHLLLFFQNMSLFMHKCKANVLEFDSASGRLSDGIQHIFWFWPWWGRGYRTRQTSAFIPCSYFLSGELIWGKILRSLPHQNCFEHHGAQNQQWPWGWSLFCSAVKPPAHRTRRLVWELYSFKEKDNSVRVYWCLLAWP